MPKQNPFYKLSTDQIISSVESALGRTQSGRRATGFILALNSLENRVYQMDFEDGFKVVTKFYRPGRWNLDQLLEEHNFLEALSNAEIPVVKPILLPKEKNQSLGASPDGIFFAVFPSVGGRLVDEPSRTHLEILGRYLGRIHRVGALFKKSSRPRLDPENFGWKALDKLLKSPHFETDSIREQYKHLATRLLRIIDPMMKSVRYQLVHGDCHLGNTLWQDHKAFFLDFDDCRFAPAVQDIWMIVRGRDEQAKQDREILISSYEQMNEFDRTELHLIEALRALRVIHYSAWISDRWEDPSFPLAFPHFGRSNYWQEEMSELQKIYEALTEESVPL